MSEEGNLLRSALESLPEPLLLWTADGRVAFVSQAFLDAFELQRDEVLGASEDRLDAVLGARGAPLRAAPAAAPGDGRRFERDRRELPGGARLELFRSVGDPHDPQTREELLGVATHDLRGPLANVRSYAGLLLGPRMADLDPRVRRSAEVIARNADKALRLLQAYFDSLRAETGYLDVHREAAPLKPILEELLASRQAAAAEAGVAIAASLSEALPDVAVDRDRFLNALAAFLDHAIGREPRGGTVRVECAARPDEVRVDFVDHGPQLDPEQVRQLFDRDRQILREKRLGVGFALSVGRAIAAAHGGRAGVDSRPDRTTYFVALPR